MDSCPSLARRLGKGIALYLLLVEPLRFGAFAASSLSRLVSYGWPAWVLLAYRAGVVGFGMAAGRMLMASGDTALAVLFLPLNLAGVLATLPTPFFPSNRVPGTKPAEALLVALLHLAAYVVLRAAGRSTTADQAGDGRSAGSR